MFKSARIKLTLWYQLIIMAISLLFSLIIFQLQIGEAENLLQRQRLRIQRADYLVPIGNQVVDTEILEEARENLLRNLLGINLGVLVLAGAAGYFLSGRTLKPVEDMVEDQKRFISDASHELRTPLATMKTELEVNLKSRHLPLSFRNILKSSLEEVDKMSYLSEKLLHLASFEGRSHATFTKVSLKEVTESVINKFQKAAQTKKIKIYPDLTTAWVWGEETALQEAIGTILDNAIKYSPPDSQINLTIKGAKGHWELKIQDFGVGIKAGDLPFIFRRFYRADQSRSKTKTEGFGLGLAIAKTIIDSHQGTIDVSSTPDMGTTFTISLPAFS